jgi:hypothetical protein
VFERKKKQKKKQHKERKLRYVVIPSVNVTKLAPTYYYTTSKCRIWYFFWFRFSEKQLCCYVVCCFMYFIKKMKLRPKMKVCRMTMTSRNVRRNLNELVRHGQRRRKGNGLRLIVAVNPHSSCILHRVRAFKIVPNNEACSIC